MHRRSLSVLVVALFAAIGDVAWAESPPPRALTLDEATEIALGHNPGLVAAGQAAAAAAEGIEQAKGRYLPKIDLTETASRTNNPTLVFSNLLGQENFGAANFAVPTLNEPDPLDNFNTRLTLTQPIYAGGRISAGKKASQHVAAAARGQQERARQETIFQTTRAYQGVLLARSQLQVAEAARAAAREHLRIAESLVQGGLAVPSDVMRVKVRLAEIEEMVIRATAGEQVARAGLEAVMGARPEGPYDLVEPAEARADLPEVEAAVQEALQRRADLAAAREGAAAASQGVRAAKGGWLPQVGFSAFYEVNGDTFLGSTGQNWAAFVVAGISLFDGLSTASSVRQSHQQEARAGTMVKGFESQVEMEVRQAHAEVAGALARREAARSAVAQAEDAVRIVRDRYEGGLATVTDLLDQETALTDARARAAQADYDCRNGETALRLAMGTLEWTPEEVRT